MHNFVSFSSEWHFFLSSIFHFHFCVCRWSGPLSWSVSLGPLLPPSPSDPLSWKTAYVYGFDSLPDPTDSSFFLVFYNARDGWREGREAIGVSRVEEQVLEGGQGRWRR